MNTDDRLGIKRPALVAAAGVASFMFFYTLVADSDFGRAIVSGVVFGFVAFLVVYAALLLNAAVKAWIARQHRT